MHQEYKPQGYNSISPYLVVAGAQKLIDLLKGIFDAKELRRFDNPDGTIMHIELQIDDSVIMLGDAGDEFPPNQMLIHVYVPDVKRTFAKAIKLGCKALEEPVHKAHDPDMRGSFKDFNGNTWAIGTQL